MIFQRSCLVAVLSILFSGCGGSDADGSPQLPSIPPTTSCSDGSCLEDDGFTNPSLPMIPVEPPTIPPTTSCPDGSCLEDDGFTNPSLPMIPVEPPTIPPTTSCPDGSCLEDDGFTNPSLPMIPDFTISGADKAYTANSQVMLKVSFGEEDAYSISYLWSQVSGTPVSIQDPTLQNINFVVPANIIEAQELVFRLDLTSEHSERSQTIKIAVYSPLTINPVETPITALGDQVQLKISGGNNNGLNFSSSNNEVATVDAEGVLTPLNSGQVTIEVTQAELGLVPALSAEISLIVTEAEDTTVYLDLPIEVTNGTNSLTHYNMPTMSEDKDTSFTTYARAIFGDEERIAELNKVDGVWKGTLQQIPAGISINLTTHSLDFAGQEIYQQSQELLLEEGETQPLVIQQQAVEPENIVTVPIDRCENYVDDKGNIYPITKDERVIGDGMILHVWGYTKDRQFVRHHDCQAAYVQYYPSGRLARESHYLHGVNHNNGEISSVHYLDAVNDLGNPIKSFEYRHDENGDYIILNDQPSVYQYYPSGRIRVKSWKVGADYLSARDFGPDSITYSDTPESHYSSMIWHDAEQNREKESVFNDDGTVQWCNYIDPLTNAEMHYNNCQVIDEYGQVVKTESDLDRQYGIDTNDDPIIEPVNECTHFIDADGTVYPIQSQISSSGYVTTGYYKDGQYTYHNQCKPAMTRFYASGNPEHAWTFRKGLNTNPDGYTSFAYYDRLDTSDEPLLKMESKIEDEHYVIVDDQPSVIKYFINGDIQYQSWMKTNAQGEWVYGRDAGPDIINYGYGVSGEYQQKDLYWYNEFGDILKRKLFNDSGNVDYCQYYKLGHESQFDAACVNEAELDIEYQIM
ncbi:PKD domain-containing protein [Vibrio vulnificus]|uniref:PKD domain-containing protein n=1 Tax=Vibrio vulnificus TaxID=672 RepID=UPI00031BD6FF|nr:Ig-like domain-containing protein [Vibrio vulnificus]